MEAGPSGEQTVRRKLPSVPPRVRRFRRELPEVPPESKLSTLKKLQSEVKHLEIAKCLKTVGGASKELSLWGKNEAFKDKCFAYVEFYETLSELSGNLAKAGSALDETGDSDVGKDLKNVHEEIKKDAEEVRRVFLEKSRQRREYYAMCGDESSSQT